MSHPGSCRSPQDGPPREGTWLPAGQNSRASQSKGKAGLFRETHIPQAECRYSQKMRVALEHRVIGFFGLCNLHRLMGLMRKMFLLLWGRVGISQELSHCPIFGFFFFFGSYQNCHCVRRSDFWFYKEGIMSQMSMIGYFQSHLDFSWFQLIFIAIPIALPALYCVLCLTLLSQGHVTKAWKTA